MDRVVGGGVGETEVLDRPQRPRVGEDRRRLDAGHARDRDEPLRDRDQRLVQRHPAVDVAAQLPGGVGGELAELADRRAREPSRPPQVRRDGVVGADPLERGAHGDRVVDPDREREVVERQHHVEAATPGAGEDPLVTAHGGVVGEPIEAPQLRDRDVLAGLDRRGRAREDPAPLDPEPDRVVAEPVRGAIEVAAPLVEEPWPVGDPVAADDAGVDQAGIGGEPVPVAAPVDVRRRPARLRLEAGRCGAPEEGPREVPGRVRRQGRARAGRSPRR